LATYILDTRSALESQQFADLVRNIRWIGIPS